MTKDVLVRISGLHLEVDAEAGKENEAIEVIVPGVYYFKNGKHYILYEEIDEGGRATKNQIKLCEDKRVEIRKSGVLTAHMIFEAGKKTQGCYQTPYGQMQVAMDTRENIITIEEKRICIEIDYRLEVNQNPFSDCRIEISITAK